uniref:NADH-ubiquinone oxidoreductase chain 5 n=1 Tax=Fulvia mutica TaxID=80828 RepID=T2HG51_FULMU|nr:NADH dehydrogenase subunit 5 [Fulvia mutica]BAN79049.1 NADH dehydrogenase subunit 5 [Fulvia mutica]
MVLLYSFFFFFLFLLCLYFSLSGGLWCVSFMLGSEFQYELSFLLDYYSSGFGCVVALISCSVVIFSCFYLSEEVYMDRFLHLIGLFVGSMFLLLISGNMFTLMMGWDGLGLISFLLVIYYESKSSLAAGMLTLMTNRIGDVLFIMSIGMMSGSMLMSFGGLSESGLGLLLCLIILVGSVTKSAQMPFSAWLPAAMAAPTPVSTLVHSSTLVTAGLFVLIRFSGGMEGAMMSCIMLVLACFTCVMAGTCAILEPDLKKIVALSTLSQLGVMGLALSFSNGDLAFFHLVVHALFKALMFMCIGSAIMLGFGIQEARYFSGMIYKMPITSVWLLISLISLMGFPFTAGFFSKDMLLEGLMSGGVSGLGVMLVYLTCFLTGCYSVRLMWIMFKGGEGSPTSVCWESWSYSMCMTALGLGSVVGGVIFQSMGLDLNDVSYISFIEKSGVMMSILAGIFLGVLLMMFSLVSSNLLIFFVSKMFFLSAVSGSPVSTSFLGGSMGVSQMESVMELDRVVSIKSSEASELSISDSYHWGVWSWLFFYMVVMSFFMISLM